MRASAHAGALPPPASAERGTTVADLTEEALHAILRRLTPADLLLAALACHRWRRAASRALPRAPPLLGYFFHPLTPAEPLPSPTSNETHHPAVFVPLDAASPLLSLKLTPTAARDLSIQDVPRVRTNRSESAPPQPASIGALSKLRPPVDPRSSGPSPPDSSHGRCSDLHASDATAPLEDHQNTGNNFEYDRAVPRLKHWLSFSSPLEWILLDRPPNSWMQLFFVKGAALS